MAQDIKKNKNINPLAPHLITEVTMNKPFVFTIDENAFPPAREVWIMMEKTFNIFMFDIVKKLFKW